MLVSSRRLPKAGRFGEAPKSFSFNGASKLTPLGHFYDGLGRNTSIPASHSPGAVGVIGLSYRLNDQVASITQNSVTTVYGFDAAGRRVTETSAGSVLTKHYTGTSDNPAWSSNNAGVSDIYTSSLGTGLNSTVHVDNGVKTVSLDVNDLRGNTVTRINIDTATTDSWISVDEYGNRDNATTGKLVTYDAYGQYERATTSQGLILMGARVYNPVTNQFTSPDPITGGNETTYTYPNDPINKTDLNGLLSIVSEAIELFADLLGAFLCATAPFIGCFIGSILIGALAGAVSAALDAHFDNDKKTKSEAAFGAGFQKGLTSSILGGSVGGAIGKMLRKSGLLRELEKNTMKTVRRLWKTNYAQAKYSEAVLWTYDRENQKCKGKKC